MADFYRVNYDTNNWNLLKEALGNGEFPEIVRAQLIDDALFLGRKGSLGYEFALDFTSHLAGYKEKEYIVWNTVLRHLNYIRNILLARVDFTSSPLQETRSGVTDGKQMSEETIALQKFKVNNFNFIFSEIRNVELK